VRVCACLCLCVSVCVSRRAFSDFERIQTRLCGRGGVVCARSDACRDHEEVYASVCSVVQRAARIREAFSTRHQRTKAAGGQRAARLARSAGAVECVRVCVCSCVRVCVCACLCWSSGYSITRTGIISARFSPPTHLPGGHSCPPVDALHPPHVRAPSLLPCVLWTANMGGVDTGKGCSCVSSERPPRTRMTTGQWVIHG